MMNAGCTQDSKRPNRNRTAIKLPKVFVAAEHETTVPQRKTLDVVSRRIFKRERVDTHFAARYFATGIFWRRKLVGYSPARMPIYKIVPSQLYCKSSYSALAQVNESPIDAYILSNEMRVFFDAHDRAEAQCAFVQTLAEVGD